MVPRGPVPAALVFASLAVALAACAPAEGPRQAGAPREVWEFERVASAATTGRLQGVVFAGSSTEDRLVDATVRLSPGNVTRAVRSTDAYWFFTVEPGDYTVTAQAPGYDAASVQRTVGANGDVWGSIGLTRTQVPTTGRFRGNVYDARAADMSTRIVGARVRAPSGAEDLSGLTGGFTLVLPPGPVTLTATKDGWVAGSVTRTVVAGQDVWGSISLTPEAVTPPRNRPPAQPVLVSPIAGAEVTTPRPLYGVGGLDDPDGDPLVLELEVYADQALATRVSRGRVDVPARRAEVTLAHGLDDLPREAVVFWRVRVLDAEFASPWTEPEAFITPAAPPPTVERDQPWLGVVRAEPAANGTPTMGPLVAPAEADEVGQTQPRLAAAPVVDPDGDRVRYAFQLAVDDVFLQVEASSGLVDDPAWTPPRPLARGAVYYARVRAADPREFGAWSAPTSFSVAADAETVGVGGGSTFDRVAAPTGEASLEPASPSCQVAGEAPCALSAAGIVALAFARAIRRASNHVRGRRPERGYSDAQR
jgi:hypothetical protein